MRLYDDDKLEGAEDILKNLGDGVRGVPHLDVVRLIESELYTRQMGVRRALKPWLDIEYIAEEQDSKIDAVCQATVAAVEAEQKRFAWESNDHVLITILSAAKDAEWATARFGYCSQKTNGFKICLPYHATLEPQHYNKVLTHEFAHVISIAESKGRLSRWLSEGFSVYASGELSGQSRQYFQANPQAWCAPETLELQFGPKLDLGTEEKWLAYQQAGWVVRYLARLKGEPELMLLLREFADEGILRNLKLLALGESKTRDAIHHVYGLGLEELFEKTKGSLASL